MLVDSAMKMYIHRFFFTVQYVNKQADTQETQIKRSNALRVKHSMKDFDIFTWRKKINK